MTSKMTYSILSAALFALVSSPAFANGFGGDGGDPQNLLKTLSLSAHSNDTYLRGGDGSDPRHGSSTPPKGGDGSDPRHR